MVCGAGCYVALVVAIMYFNCFFYNVMYILFCNVNKSHIDKSDIRADDASLIIMLFSFLFFFLQWQDQRDQHFENLYMFWFMFACVWSDSVDLTGVRVYI